MKHSMHRFNWHSLYDHQLAARDAAVSVLAQSSRAQVIMACGTGKTRVGPAVAHQLNPDSVVVYVPSLALVRQSLPDWLNSPFDRPVIYLCLCSDSSVANDAPVVTPAELKAEFNGAINAVTTSPDDVRTFLSAPSNAIRVVFCTYQSADTLAAGLPDGFSFSLGIFDEAHRTAGANQMFSGPLADAHTPIKHRLFMTATPKHVSMRQRSREGEGKTIYSMDNPEVYGPEAYQLPIRKAIRLGLISDYKVLVSVVDDSMLPSTWREEANKEKPSAAHIKTLAHAVAIKAAMEQYGVQKIITFHDTVSAAQSFAKQPLVQQELGETVITGHVCGKMPTGQRQVVMDVFTNATTSLLANARCLTEGVDVPSIDMVAFLSPRKSHVDIVQAVGRALRRSKTNPEKIGYILLPLYVSEMKDLPAFLEDSGYDAIFQVIQALREQDEVIETEIQNAVHSPRDVPAHLPFVEFSGAPAYLNELRQAISVACLDAITPTWDRNYAILKRRFEAGDSVNLPQNEIIDGIPIGHWLSRQRQMYSKNQLDSKKALLLESIGIVWNTKETAWIDTFLLLKAMYQKGRHPELKKGLVINGINVYNWAINQRQAYKEGSLSESKIRLLEEIDFPWDQFEENWNKGFWAVRFLIENGRGIKKGPLQNGINAYNWCTVQRRSYKQGALSQKRIQKLESIGFSFCPYHDSWGDFYEILKTAHEKNENINFRSDFVINGALIGKWCGHQREAYKAGKLSALRIQKLEAIGFQWKLK